MMNKKKIIVGLSLLFSVVLVIVILNTNYSYKRYVSKYNDSILGVISEIKENYPYIKDEEIKEILDGNNNEKEKGKELVKRYGISLDNSIILDLEEEHEKIIIRNIIVVIIIFIIVLIGFFIQGKKKKAKIDKIIEYIEEINKKNYSLKIEDNTDDMFSKLRNELYKITIMLKEEAENAQKEKIGLARSLGDISHQIKTPLTSISIMLDEIKENENMDVETRKKFLFEISRQIEQINFLVISLLKLSKLDANAIEFENEKYDLVMLAKETIKNLEIPLEIKEQKIVIEAKEKSLVTGDYKWTLEAITNIVKNCIEHTGMGKNIYIEIKNSELYIELNISDEGTGISEKDLKHIFERFYKGENSSENSFGIGLSLAKTILEKQNATIKCFSKLGEGTTFKIRFYR